MISTAPREITSICRSTSCAERSIYHPISCFRTPLFMNAKLLLIQGTSRSARVTTKIRYQKERIFTSITGCHPGTGLLSQPHRCTALFPGQLRTVIQRARYRFAPPTDSGNERFRLLLGSFKAFHDMNFALFVSHAFRKVNLPQKGHAI